MTQKIPTGTPRKDGRWVERWIRMTEEDKARYTSDWIDYYNSLSEMEKILEIPSYEGHAFRFKEISEFRNVCRICSAT